jgi:hypothetical protein
MELFPAVDEEQLEYIKRVIDRSDYYVVIVGGRYGTLADDKMSYTEKEYEYALERKIPVLAFLHADPQRIEVGRTDRKKSLAKKLEAFRTRLSKRVRMIDRWTDAQDLCTKVILALTHQANLTPRVGWVRGDQAVDPKMMQEMQRIRTENEDLKRRLAQLDAAPGQPFIYGGFGRRGVRVDEDGGSRIQAQVTMANYGKDPGFIRYIEVGMGSLDEGLPSQPIYTAKFDILDFYFPEMKMGDVRPTRAWIEIPGDGRHAVFQRVWYTDLSGALHFSGSIYRLEVVSEGEKVQVVDEPILSGSAYWLWDRPEKQQQE